MARNILAAALGYLVWTALFLGGSAGIRSAMPSVHDQGGFTSNVAALSLYLVLSIAASLLAGYLVARIARVPATWVWITAVALLATGIPVQLSTWDQMPVWYNLIFLIMLVPATIFGGRLGGSGSEQPSAPSA